MRKKKVFIGSSSEEIKLAEIAENILEDKYDVVIWNENLWNKSVFKLNRNFLNDLLKASLQFDFGILIGTQDDKVVYRGKEVMQPRDNILFELGLFMGRLGVSKCAFVVDSEIKLMSDVDGISLARFKNGNIDSFKEAIKKIKDFFNHQTETEVNFFPSSTLASVYFENLVDPTCRYLINNGGLEIDGKLHNDYEINIVIPSKLSSDLNIQFEQIKKNYETEKVSFEYAGRPRSILIEAEIENNKIKILDFPTILSGINHAIKNLLPEDFNKMSSDYEEILSRELHRFVKTLKHLLIKEGYDEFVNVSARTS